MNLPHPYLLSTQQKHKHCFRRSIQFTTKTFDGRFAFPNSNFSANQRSRLQEKPASRFISKLHIYFVNFIFVNLGCACLFYWWVKIPIIVFSWILFWAQEMCKINITFLVHHRNRHVSRAKGRETTNQLHTRSLIYGNNMLLISTQRGFKRIWARHYVPDAIIQGESVRTYQSP